MDNNAILGPGEAAPAIQAEAIERRVRENAGLISEQMLEGSPNESDDEGVSAIAEEAEAD